MTYETFLFKPNPKKEAEDKRETLYMGLTVGVLIVAPIAISAFFLTNTLVFFLPIGIAVGLVVMKLNDIKKKGANRFGSLTERLSLSHERLKVGDAEFLIADMEKIEIIADDYLGKSNDIFGLTGGVDNYIEFVKGGVEYSFPFQVKKYSDLKTIAEIEKQIIHDRTKVAPGRTV